MNKRANITSSLFDPSMMRSSASTPELELSRQIYQAVRTSFDGIILITPALAQRILDLLNFKRQRRVKPAEVMSMKSTILSGKWNFNHPIFFARVDETLIGVNLQHRMHAIVAAQTEVRSRVIIADCADDKEVAEFYGQFDKKSGSRGEVDAIVARDLAGDTGLTLSMVTRAMAALKILMNDVAPLVGGSLTMDKVVISMAETRIAEFPKWISEITQWDAIQHTSPPHVRRKLITSAIMAVGLYTLKHQPEVAAEFWVGLANNDKLAKDDPRARLLADFVTRKGTATREVIQAASLAWNAWYAKRSLGGIRIDPDNPIHFAGTPLANRKK